MGGYRAEELIGRLPPMLYWAPENAEQSRRRHEQLLARTLSSDAYESVYLRRDGSRLTVLVSEAPLLDGNGRQIGRSDEHTSELQSLMRNSYAVFCLKKKKR